MQDRLHFGVVFVDQQFRAIKTDAPQDPQRFVKKSDVENRLGQLDVPEMARAIVHVTRTCLTAGKSVDNPLIKIFESLKLKLLD